MPRTPAVEAFILEHAASSAQIGFINTLRRAKEGGDADRFQPTTRTSKQDASRMIDELKTLPPKRIAPVVTEEHIGVWYDADDRICKIIPSQEGNLYAMWLDFDGEEPGPDNKGTWVYFPGGAKKIVQDGRRVPDDDHNFRIIGRCVRCGRTLTKLASIERGMGDICAGLE